MYSKLFILLTLIGGIVQMDAAILQIKSEAFKDSQPIPSKYTCDGENISPPLQWSGIPQGTKSLVLIVDDPDAPKKAWTHWVVFNIAPTLTEIKEGEYPKGAYQGINDFKHPSYGGPCPPSGSHRYYFKLFALNDTLKLSPGATKEQVEKAMQHHIIGQAQLIGTYSRK